MTNNKLYVGNLPPEASEHALRAHFSTCGGVSDVEILLNRRDGQSRGLAFVTMTSPAFATAALDRLNGATFEGRPLRVSDTPLNKQKPDAPSVKVTQQFRERHNMTYDLDCLGVPLTVRVFPEEGEQWRIEARMNDTPEAVVSSASASSRRAALDEVGRRWHEKAAALSLPNFDWAAIATAMDTVRAL